jgi:hypothetical protein
MKRVLLALLLLPYASTLAQTQPPPPSAPPPSVREKFFFGGGVGLSFGEVDYVEIAPLVGYRFHSRADGGVQLFYRWRNDGRYDPDLSTSDYGADVFVRYFVVPTVFAQAQFETVNYEFVLPNLQTDRDTFNSYLLGGGFSQPIGKGAGLYVSALYNFSYDDSDVNSPYSDPWVIQAGVTVGL